jgi:hypothetical protein
MSESCEIVEFTGYSCNDASAGSGAGGSCSDWYTSCRNPLYALDHPDECGSGLAVSELVITPPAMTIPAGRGGYLQAIALFNDGRAADVTGETAFASADTGVLVSLGNGLIEGVAAGATAVTGIWNGKTAVAEVTVSDVGCIADVPWDVVVVADDGVVWVEAPVFVVRNEASQKARALRRIQSNARQFYPAAILQLMLSMDLLDSGGVTSADGYVAEGWTSTAPLPTGIGGTRAGSDRIWTGSQWSNQVDTATCFIDAQGDTGKALMDAAQILVSSGRPGARKLVVLFSTGGEKSCSPSIRSAAATLVGNGFDLAVVTPLSASDTAVVSKCDLMPAHAMLQEIPSAPCYFFDGASPKGGVFSAMLATVCGGCSGSSGQGFGLDEI